MKSGHVFCQACKRSIIEGYTMKSVREAGCPFPLSGKCNRSLESILCKMIWPQQQKWARLNVSRVCSEQSPGWQPTAQVPQVARPVRPPDGNATLRPISPSGSFTKWGARGRDIPCSSITSDFHVTSAPKFWHIKEKIIIKEMPQKKWASSFVKRYSRTLTQMLQTWSFM